ncbi:hypothetical protein NE237_010960 [Protea cynaroides]|uniref:Uncharacterized protein n=1 Tax=Protea cynaroides TaxID=273540 RepID=A0A9Q0L0S8_9MAGN|nr:hypothetical protein NE237_010960 [Protea cynaroides]
MKGWGVMGSGSCTKICAEIAGIVDGGHTRFRRVGNELGANRPRAARLAAIVSLLCSFLLGFSALMFALTVRSVWARMFTLDAEVISLTSMVLPIIGLCELGNYPQTTGYGVLRGTTQPKGLWVGLLVAQFSCMMIMMLVLERTEWNLQARKAQALTGAIADDDKHADANATRTMEKQKLTSSATAATTIAVGISLSSNTSSSSSSSESEDDDGLERGLSNIGSHKRKKKSSRSCNSN